MKLVIFIALSIFLMAPAARAQVASATLSGTVRDASDATIGGARISVTESATGFARETVTDVLGRYLADGSRDQAACRVDQAVRRRPEIERREQAAAARRLGEISRHHLRRDDPLRVTRHAAINPRCIFR